MKYLPIEMCRWVLFSFVVLIAGFSAEGFAESASEKGFRITQEADQFNDGFKGETASLEMVLINAHGDKIVRKMDSMTKETQLDGDKSIVTFVWPADVKGTRMLTWSHKTTTDDQWLYLPSLKRVRRINSRSRTGSFMGSEFSYEDLGSQEVEKFTYKFIADETLDRRPTWLIERVPTDKNSGYSRQLVWMDHEYQNPTKIEYYDRKGDLLKTALFSGYQLLGKWWRVSQITMTNHQTRKSSVLSWRDRKLGVAYREDEFHKDSLIQ